GEGKNKPILSDNQAIAILAAKMEENEGQLIRIVEKINEIIEENMGQFVAVVLRNDGLDSRYS
ncbi:33300_t:CDS:2, partial [Racocetra persica]